MQTQTQPNQDLDIVIVPIHPASRDDRAAYFRMVDEAANVAAEEYHRRPDCPKIRNELTHRIKVMDHLRGMPWGAP